MRFNNDDYLRAFPREERAAAEPKQIIKDKPGNVLENVEKEADPEPETPAEDPEPAADLEGGEADGNE